MQTVTSARGDSISNTLYSLLSCLHSLGVDYPQLLIQLTSILQPNLSNEMIVPLLRKMFEEIPSFLQEYNPIQLQKMLLEPNPDLLTWKIFVDFRDLQQLLHQVSYLQLLHLSNNLIPPGPLPTQLEFLLKAQEQFQAWTQESLHNLHNILSETPLHMERQQLLQLEPLVPWELLHFLIELLKLPIEELIQLQDWLCKLPKKQLLLILQLLQIEPSAALLEIKRRLDSIILNENNNNIDNIDSINNNNSNISIEDNSNNNNNGIMTPTMSNTIQTTKITTPISYSNENNINLKGSNNSITSSSGSIVNSNSNTYQLRIVRQPPTRTVYQRILKPFPSVMLVGGPTPTEQAISNSNLFVEATLLRSDADVELPLSIEGNRIVRISNGVFATFKKLKILSTSQQQGTLFRLKFTLKRYVGNVFEQIPTSAVITNPIEVFSHTLYLTDKQEAPPPVVYEILPPIGKLGTRVVILGSNFVNSPSLRVRIGNTEVTPTFHEQGTLICTVPNIKPEPSGVPVRVSNDAINFCETKVFFNFTT